MAKNKQILMLSDNYLQNRVCKCLILGRSQRGGRNGESPIKGIDSAVTAASALFTVPSRNGESPIKGIDSILESKILSMLAL